METINNYIVGETLGEGSFGKVKLGISLEDANNKVALKIMKRLSDERDLKSFQNEINLML